MKNSVNTFGIVLTTTGSFLVWRYLTELNWADKNAFLRGEGRMVIPSPSKKAINKFKCQLMLSKLGFGLILVGGFFQILSNYIGD
jgi:hypothetical protein